MSSGRYKKSLRERIKEVDPNVSDTTIKGVRLMVINGHKQIPEVLRKCFKITKFRHGYQMAFKTTEEMCRLFFPLLEWGSSDGQNIKMYVLLARENFI